MGMINLIRRAAMRFSSAKLVQKYNITVFETNSADGIERFQDYGFTGQPAEGQGLVIDAGGTFFVLRVDQLKERPELADDEVAVWHKEGHKIHLKGKRLIQVECDDFEVKAKKSIKFDTENFECTSKTNKTETQTHQINAETSSEITTPKMGISADKFHSTGPFNTERYVHAKEYVKADDHVETDGYVTAKGKVTGGNDVIGGGVSLKNHVHKESVGDSTDAPTGS